MSTAALLAIVILVADAAPPRRDVGGLDDATSLRLPAVADALGLSKKQRERVQSLLKAHGKAFAPLLRGYPQGAQDNEGAQIRTRSQRELEGLTKQLTTGLLGVLEPGQRAALGGHPRVALLTLPERDEERRGRGLQGFERLGLTQRQWQSMPRVAPRVERPEFDLERAPSEKQRREMAERVVKYFTAGDRARRAVLNEEQRLIADELDRRAREQEFYLWGLHQQQMEHLVLPAPKGKSLEAQACFAVLFVDGKERFVLPHPCERLVNAHAFSPSGKLLATAATTFPQWRGGNCNESVLRIWEVSTGRLLEEILSSRAIMRVAFLDDRVLAVHSIRLHD